MRGLRFGFGFNPAFIGDATPPVEPPVMRRSLIIFDQPTNAGLLNPTNNAVRTTANDWVTLQDENNGLPNWASDTGGSTVSTGTGPPAVNPYPFLYGETSATGYQVAQDPLRMTIANADFATARDRTLRFIYNAYGSEFNSHTGEEREGVELVFRDAEGNAVGESYWLNPWDSESTDTDVEGDAIPWSQGTTDTPLGSGSTARQRAFGWADSGEIAVPAGAADVYLILRNHHISGEGNAFRHDISLRELDIRYTTGGRDTAFDDSYDEEGFQ